MTDSPSKSDTLPVRPFLRRMHGYVPGEQPQGRKILKLNTNENPYPPDERVFEEIQRAVPDLALYPNPHADSLRRALAAYHGLRPEQVLAGNGSDEVLRLLVHGVIGPGDKIAVVDPSYSLYPVLAEAFDGGTTVYPLEDLETLPEAFYDAPEPLLFLPNPNAPIGTLYDRATIAELCGRRPGRLVVIDEAYVDFAPQDTVHLMHEFDNLAVTRSFSKSFSLAGMRLGYLLGSEELVYELDKIKDSYNLNLLAQVAAVAAISRVAGMQENARKIIATRESTAGALRDMGFRVPDSHGNFLFAMHPEARRLFEGLRERDILVRYFDKPNLCGGFRVSIGLPEQMEHFLKTLKELL